MLRTEGAVLRGNPEASLVLMVFSDYECPACRRFARETMPVLFSKYVNTGRLLLALRHLPLQQIHPTAFNAAEAAECAGRQGRFWEMHDAIFGRSGPFDDEVVFGLAGQLGLRTEEFARCMQGEVAAKIHADLEVAASLRINGTPAFLLFQKQEDGGLRPLRRFSGALPPERMEAVLESTSDVAGR